VYVNGKMRPVKTILGMGVRVLRILIEGLNPTMKYSKNFYKCYNISPA
jgi:hypothetical protein